MRNGPGEESREMRRDERDVGRGRTIGGVASRKVFVKNRKLAAFNSADQRLATGVAQCRKPSTVMGIKITQNNGISGHIVQERLKVWPIAWSAGRRWGIVDVEDREALMTEMNIDALEFEVRISANEIVNVDRGKLHVMTDEGD